MSMDYGSDAGNPDTGEYAEASGDADAGDGSGDPGFLDNLDLDDLDVDDPGQGAGDTGSDWGSDPAQVAAINDQNAAARAEAIAGGMDESDANIMYPDIDPANPYAIN